MFDLEPPPERGPYAGYTHPSAPSLDNTNQWGSDAERYFQLARAALATGTAIVDSLPCPESGLLYAPYVEDSIYL